MQSSLAITALMMGVLGGPHCVAMCGAACAGLGQAAGERMAHAVSSLSWRHGPLVLPNVEGLQRSSSGADEHSGKQGLLDNIGQDGSVNTW